MRCGECGSRNAERQNAKGKTFPHRTHSHLELIYDLYLETCTDCGNIMMRLIDAKLLSLALDETEKHMERNSIKCAFCPEPCGKDWCSAKKDK